LYNGRDHFYTIDVKEANNALDRLGYRLEGKAGYVFHPDAPANAKLPNFYRLFNSKTGDHFYTASWEESQKAQSRRSGYKYEGIACKLYTPNFKGAANERVVPFYRLYLPRGGDHFYTTSASEAENAIRVGGYINEGTAGYISP
jgi:hypothetical protein